MCLAVPGCILSTTEVDGTVMADVDFGGVRKEVCLQYIPDAAVGEYVVVHVGFAIQRLDEESALRTLADFDRLGILAEEFGDGFETPAQHKGVRPAQPAPDRSWVPGATGAVREGADS
ncbi:HypC/HybG/HupF family hydrogenase formation chaperone [Streptomyces sp. NPDC049040]|uniref:HypC/HybG/HupF family hydrogenase formation chaperone n=1 Tax=Streptomyces sp. NPDC049040 TaxID=3365593 RepID=UPI00371F1B71